MGPRAEGILPLIHVLSTGWGEQGGHGRWRSKGNDGWATGSVCQNGGLPGWKAGLREFRDGSD